MHMWAILSKSTAQPCVAPLASTCEDAPINKATKYMCCTEYTGQAQACLRRQRPVERPCGCALKMPWGRSLHQRDVRGRGVPPCARRRCVCWFVRNDGKVSVNAKHGVVVVCPHRLPSLSVINFQRQIRWVRVRVRRINHEALPNLSLIYAKYKQECFLRGTRRGATAPSTIERT